MARLVVLIGIFAATLAVSPAPARADVLRVPQDFARIQEAIDAAWSGDEIRIAEGVYVENLMIRDKSLDLVGEGATTTVLDGHQRDRSTILLMHDGKEGRSRVRIRGLQITGGRGTPDVRKQWTALLGGGVCALGTDLVLERCWIHHNGDEQALGGGVYLERGVVRDCLIEENKAAAGGGISARTPTLSVAVVVEGTVVRRNRAEGGGGLEGSRLELRDCRILENRAQWSGGGADVYDASLIRCEVADNVAEFDAGGLSLAGDSVLEHCELRRNQALRYSGGGILSRGSLEVRGCRLEENYAAIFGGGLDVRGSYPPFRIVDTEFVGNSCDRTGESYGGAMFLNGRSDGPHTVQNCLFARNYVGGGGGALYLGVDYSQASFLGCTFANNRAEVGGAVYLTACDCRFRDCVVWGNWALEYPSLFPPSWYKEDPYERWCGTRLDDCDIEGGFDGPGESNFDADPLFVRRGQQSYFLSQRRAGQGLDSPCLDRGGAPLGGVQYSTATNGLPDRGVRDLGYRRRLLPARER